MEEWKNEDGECKYCGGDGEVTCDVFDPDSGQYMRGVGIEKCICQLEENKEDY